MQRWERAQQLGLGPPPEVPELVRKHGLTSTFNADVFSEGKPF